MSRTPWSREEVEATVASYFRMLESGLRGESFNKSALRRELLPLLRGRTNSGVERKHQNISAVLRQERIPYISGYKPLGNYQALLREVALEQLAARPDLQALIAAAIQVVPEVPTFDDILRVLVQPPAPRAGLDRRPPGARSPTARPSPDYVLMEASNRALGLAGETFVVRLEQARLEAAGKGRLAAQVCHVSVEQGDGLGYDVLSYDPDSRERLIEVKTTRFGEYTPFHVTANELQVSRTEAPRYHLYRLFAFGPEARLFTVPGALDQSFRLEAESWMARVG
jgi:hypothetical protein